MTVVFNHRAIARLLMALALTLIAAATANAACMFRVNGWEATDEGVVLTRYAANVSGPSLVAATRYVGRDPAAVRAAFDAVRLTFDMNGDGNVTAVDAVIVLRYVSGIRGAALTDGLSLVGGTRTTSQSIQAFIESGCVAPIALRAPIYEALVETQDRATFLAQTNAQGARSFVILSPLIVGGERINFYALDTPGVFTYRSLDTPATATAFEQLLNAQGADRYRFGGPLVSGSYFYRDENSNRTFSYRVLVQPGASADFLAQANAQGGEGYNYVLPLFLGATSYAVYVKENGSNAVYAWASQPSIGGATAASDLVAQANAQGANGFKFRTPFFFTDGQRNLYVKDTSQSATFAWKDNPDVASAAALVTQANAEGANGYVYRGSYSFSNPSQTRVFYFRPVNCSGSVLCSPSGPF